MKEIEPKDTPEITGGITAPGPVAGTSTPPYVPPATMPGTETDDEAAKVIK